MKEWIGYYKNIVPEKLCDDIMNDNFGGFEWKSSTYSTHGGKNKDSSHRVVMDETYIKTFDRYFKDLSDCVEKVIENYKQIHSYMKYYNPKRITDFRVNRYGVGGFMSEHADNIHHSHGQQYGYPSASLLLFLNDDYEGGNLIVANNKCKTEKSSAIIFPSNFMFPHEVKPITKGMRYSIITWLM